MSSAARRRIVEPLLPRRRGPCRAAPCGRRRRRRRCRRSCPSRTCPARGRGRSASGHRSCRRRRATRHRCSCGSGRPARPWPWSTASSKPLCISSLSARRVAYVILMRGLASDVMVDGSSCRWCRAREARRKVAVSLRRARVRRRRLPGRGDGVGSAAATLLRRDLDVGHRVLAGQDEDAAQAGALRGPDVGADVVADHRDVGAGEVAADLSAEVGDGDGEELGMWLADDAGSASRSRTRGRRRTRPSRASGPPASATRGSGACRRASRRRGRGGTRGSCCRRSPPRVNRR